MKRERVTLITLGVQDLDRSRRFYADWGWQARIGIDAMVADMLANVNVQLGRAA